MRLRLILKVILALFCLNLILFTSSCTNSKTKIIKDSGIEREVDHLLQSFVEEDLISGSILIAEGEKI